MPLNPGAQLGSYEIMALIGAGGMGEVYRARDTRLKRDVAIKVLPDAFAQDAERLARFQREAELLATLNHPNIGGIYGFEQATETSAIVLELVEGETLADRIQRGPLPVKVALHIGLQIAEALEAAHERGIIHRDLKPANIKLTADDKVKVLDFGLAKAMDNGSVRLQADLSHSPTLSMMATQAGMVLGTAAYMSPEQAKGFPADQRSDIFSFGAVLYEVLTGRQPFQGDTAPDMLASVIVREVDLNALPPNLNPRLKELLERCLEKNPKKRWQAIGDVHTELERIVLVPHVTSALAPKRRRLWTSVALAIGAAAVGVTFTFMAFTSLTPDALHVPVSRFSVTLPDGYEFSNAPRHVVAISPDSTHIVFVANRQLYVRAMSEYDARPIAGTESPLGPSNPVFSPDGGSLAFYAAGAIRRIALSGGAAVVVCQADPPFGLSWGEDGILFGQGSKGIHRVSVSAGKAEVIVPAKSGEVLLAGQMLPDREAVLFTVALENAADRWNTALIVVQNVKTGVRKTLIEGGSDARYVPTGHLLYALGSTLLAVPFDTRRVEVVGSATPVAQQMQRAPITTGTAQFAVSPTGTLVYLPGQSFAVKGAFVYRSRDGREIRPITGESENYPRYPRVSPDGRWMAVTVGPTQQGNIWTYDLKGGRQPQKLTNEGHNILPVWSPNGARIYFFSVRATGGGLWSIAADGSEAAPSPLRLSLSSAGGNGPTRPQDFSPDGLLMVSPGAPEGRRLFLTPVADNATPKAWLGTEYFEDEARFSRDGKFVAYASDSTGQVEIWVRPYPGPGAPIRVSNGGGHDPVWSKDGTELFFQSGPRMMSVKILATSPEFRAGAPIELFSGGFLQWAATLPRTYDVAADGRFLMVQTSEQRTTRREIRVVLNWFEELKQRVPLTRD
jgi:serine/threonine-protein kinase